jgi:hypothetical protein
MASARAARMPSIAASIESASPVAALNRLARTRQIAEQASPGDGEWLRCKLPAALERYVLAENELRTAGADDLRRQRPCGAWSATWPRCSPGYEAV